MIRQDVRVPIQAAGADEMSNAKQETIADIVADIRAQNQGLPEDSYALSPLVCDLLSLANRIEAAAKPVRKCDKYRTAEEAHVAFAEFCGKNKCGSCRFGDSTRTAGCVLEWLYEEAGKEAK